MNAIGYLMRKEIKNGFKELLHKPAKLVLYIVVTAFFVVMLIEGAFSASARQYEMDIRYLQAGYLALLIFFLCSNLYAGLQRGATFFSMSDVNYLFVSPLSSKRILIYGLIKQMGSTIIAMLFMVCYSATLMQNFAISTADMLAMIFGVILVAFSAQVLSLLLYSVTNQDDRKVQIARGIITMIPVCAALVLLFVYWQSGLSLDAMLTAMAGPQMEWIPIAGWIKGAVFALIGKNFFYALILIGIFVLALLGIVIAFIKSDADYYEDVLDMTEHNYAIQRAAKSGRTSANAALRSRKIRVNKTGLNGGWGASTFFYKHVLEMRRKDRLPFIGKSTVACLAICLVVSKIIETNFAGKEDMSSGMLMMICLIIAGYVEYFMQVSGPWTLELVKPYIYLVPEKPFKKLLWAVLTSIIKPFVDAVILFTVMCAVLRGNPLTAVSCALCLGTLGMAFISVSVLSERLFGRVQNKGLIVIFYLLVLMVIVLPGVIASGYLVSQFLPQIPGWVCGLPAIFWNALVSIGIFAACRNILENTEMEL